MKIPILVTFWQPNWKYGFNGRYNGRLRQSKIHKKFKTTHKSSKFNYFLGHTGHF